MRRIAAERARQLTDDQVVARYTRLFAGAKDKLEALRRSQRKGLIQQWRGRLMDISWMMRSLNEWMARRANLGDGCTGRFWEGRFKSQALLDEEGLLTCMAYVDLNPIRAGVAKRPEAADFTSIQAPGAIDRAALVKGASAHPSMNRPCWRKNRNVPH